MHSDIENVPVQDIKTARGRFVIFLFPHFRIHPFPHAVRPVGDDAVRAKGQQGTDSVLGVHGPERGLDAHGVELVHKLGVGIGGVVLAADDVHREIQRFDVGSHIRLLLQMADDLLHGLAGKLARSISTLSATVR